MHMHNVKRSRPLTHDLVRSLIVGMGAQLRRVQITRVEKRPTTPSCTCSAARSWCRSTHAHRTASPSPCGSRRPSTPRNRCSWNRATTPRRATTRAPPTSRTGLAGSRGAGRCRAVGRAAQGVSGGTAAGGFREVQSVSGVLDDFSLDDGRARWLCSCRWRRSPARTASSPSRTRRRSMPSSPAASSSRARSARSACPA